MSYTQNSSSTTNFYVSTFQDENDQSNVFHHEARLPPNQENEHLHEPKESLYSNVSLFLDHLLYPPRTLPEPQPFSAQRLLSRLPAVASTLPNVFSSGPATFGGSSTHTPSEASLYAPSLSQPPLQHKEAHYLSQDAHSLALSQKENGTRDTVSPCLEASLYFAIINMHEDEVCQVQNLPARFNGFPIILEEMTDFATMRIFQEKHFGNTYRSLGLSIEDIHGYGIGYYDPVLGSSSQVFTSTERAWRKCLNDINSLYHTFRSCLQPTSCLFCKHQPRVYTFFEAERIRDVLLNNVRPSAELQYHDAYDPEHAQGLGTHHWSHYMRYNNICQEIDVTNGATQPELQNFGLPGTTQLYAPLAITPPSNYNQVLTYVEPSQNNLIALPFQPSLGANGIAPPLQDLPQGVDEVRGPLGRRLVNPDTYNKPPTQKDYSKAAEQPKGSTKRDEDMCLTCIYHGRGCKGTELVMVKGKYRCPCCATKRADNTGMRRCYWRNEAAGIRTYEDAKAADPHKFVNEENTRGGKLARAQKRLKQKAERAIKSATNDALMTDQ
ncbi:hypothetical protein LTR64_006074 [Lithohypha guttulata]|uniref:uncharacterized protein n=1 Tax=Lithohypha guttulata TaxID=1690604 RepID=UPI002DDE7E1A|nr:hypothetical protein LTR51_002128 [Lithohypha guttulata]